MYPPETGLAAIRSMHEDYTEDPVKRKTGRFPRRKRLGRSHIYCVWHKPFLRPLLIQNHSSQYALKGIIWWFLVLFFAITEGYRSTKKYTVEPSLPILKCWLRVIELIFKRKTTVIGFVRSPSLAPYKEPKSGIPEIFLLIESRILEILLVEFGVLGFGIQNIAQGIRNEG